MSAKQKAIPTVAIAMPASAGPIVRAALTSALLRLTALTSRSRPTSSTRNACRVGWSIALSAPRTKMHRSTIHSAIAPPSVSASSASAGSAMPAWVAISSRRFGSRSASSPAQAPPSSIGANCRAAARPTATPLWVSCRTSHVSAIVCIHVPLSDTIWPPK